MDRLDLGLREQSVGWALNGDSDSQSRHITGEGGESLTTFKLLIFNFTILPYFTSPMYYEFLYQLTISRLHDVPWVIQ